MALPDCTLLYITLLWFCLNLHYSSTSLHWTLHYTTMALLHSTGLCINVLWLYFTTPDYTLLYYGSTSLHLTIHYSTMALLHSTLALLHSTSLHMHNSTLALPDCTLLYIISLL